MVQVINLPPSRKTKVAQYIGETLGQGLNSFISNYNANKALNGVIENPDFKNAPESERLQKLTTALTPHGELGEKALKNQMLVEQQRQKEQLEKRESKTAKQMAKQFGLTDEEAEGMSPNQLIEIAKLKNAVEIAKTRQQGKAPPGGLGGQPVPPEQNALIEKVLSENPNASPSQLNLLMGKANINPAYSKPYVDAKIEEEKSGEKKENRAFKTHQLSHKMDEDIIEKGKSADRQLQAVDVSRKAIRSGNVRPGSLSNVLRSLGGMGNNIADALLNKDEAKLLGSIPAFIEGMKDLFGVRLSDADLRIVQDKLPSLGKSPEANEAILDIIEKYANMAKDRSEISREIKKENKGLRPIDFDIQLEERLEKRQHPGKVKMRSPSGKIAWVDEDKVDAAIQAQGQRI